jgi:hypothetical protein
VAPTPLDPSARRHAATSPELPVERPVAWIGLLVLCALVAYAAMAPIANPDLGWHLALGRFIVETGSVPDTEPFTHTARGAPMVAFEWLSQTAYYGLTQAAGLLGLRWANAGLTALLLVAFFAMLRRAGVAPALALLGVGLYAVIAQPRFQLRPHMFNIAFLMAMYAALFAGRPALDKRQQLGVFAATLLWSNMHSGAVLFPVLLAIHLAAEWIDRRLGRREPRAHDAGPADLRRWAALLALTAAALVITPNHFRLFPHLIESARLNTQVSLEWLSMPAPWDAVTKSPLAVSCFWLVAAATAVAAWLTRRRQPLSRLSVVLFATWLPIHSQRFAWLYFIPLLFTLGELSRWLHERDRALAPPRRTRARALASVAALVALAGITTPSLVAPIPWSHLGRRFHADRNFRPTMFPIAALDFLDEVDLRGPLFNSNKWGGYILWRTHDKYPVFIDGRWVTIGETVLLDSYRVSHRLPASFAILDAYGIEILLLHRGWMTADLLATHSWVPVFENLNSGVYLRDRPESADNLERCAAYYRAHGIPFSPQAGFDEHAAFLANPGWAKRFGVTRFHLDQVGAHGRHLDDRETKRVPGW